MLLKAQLNSVKAHMEMDDDKVTIVRIEFGTAKIAAAFGCDMYILPTISLVQEKMLARLLQGYKRSDELEKPRMQNVSIKQSLI